MSREAAGRGPRRRFAWLGPFALLVVLGSVGAQAQTRYLAFGDSITFGVGDGSGRPELGYPSRLEELLAARGRSAVVENFGLPGETTLEGLDRLDDVLAEGGDVLLLMEGTNDIGARVSPETIRFNLEQMAAKAANAGLVTVLVTVVPRLPTANFDGQNRVTGALAAEIRDLAWSTDRDLVDPFEVFLFQTPNVFGELYVGGDDRLHPNAAGYERMAGVFADALTGSDRVPPVPGRVIPADGSQGVNANIEIRVEIFDFGAGLNTNELDLRVNGESVTTGVRISGRRVELTHQPPSPLAGVVEVAVEARDLAVPAQTLHRTLSQFVVEGTGFFPGDIDRDGRVDGADLVAFGIRFGAAAGESRYRSFADLNSDGIIDGMDLAILAADFGRRSF